ncbi:MAG: O-antigen ligase family protein, partial [Asticcacaulis sp.]
MTRARIWAIQPDVLLSWACGIFLLLAFSQAWIFPIFGEEISPSAGSLIRLVFFPAYVAGFYLLFSSGLRGIEAVVRAPILLALLVTAGLSYFWSFEPSSTLKRVIALGLTMACAYGLAARFSWNTLAEVVGGAFLVLIVFSFLLAILLPEIGRMTNIFPGAWRGAWPEKNNLGGNMTIGCMILLAAAILNPARRWLWLGGAGLALLLILLSTSKTSLVAFILGCGCLVFVFLVRRGPVLGTLTVWLAIAGILLVGGIIVFAAEEILGLLGKDATLTGRTQIWDGVSRVIAERPLTG